MTKGASANADRAFAASRSSQQAVSPVPASIPCADDHFRSVLAGIKRLVELDREAGFDLSGAIGRMRAADITDAHIGGLEWAAHCAEHLNGWGAKPAPELADHIAKCIRERASAIEARRAETLGSVHESAVGEAETPKADSHAAIQKEK